MTTEQIGMELFTSGHPRLVELGKQLLKNVQAAAYHGEPAEEPDACVEREQCRREALVDLLDSVERFGRLATPWDDVVRAWAGVIAHGGAEGYVPPSIAPVAFSHLGAVA